jgi:hypothetical protein
MIKELQKLLKIDAPTAARVLHEMDCSGIDYSECTTREFNRCAREALADLPFTEEDMNRALSALDNMDAVLVPPPATLRARVTK